jgi:hypothetical protein
MALVYLNLIVKENSSKDTLTAFAKNFLPIGYIITKAVVSGSKVVFFGIYGIKRTDVWEYPKLPKNYNNIIYYKGSKAWYIMLQRAAGVSGKLSYSK